MALPYDRYCKDPGTWNTLTEEMATSQQGNGVVSDDTVNTHLINELDIPVTVIGVKYIVVAASPDGIPVADKAFSLKSKIFSVALNSIQCKSGSGAGLVFLIMRNMRMAMKW